MLKTVVVLDIFVEAVIRNFKRTAFNWNIKNNVKVFLTFDQFDVPLLNKSINLFTKLKILLNPHIWTKVYIPIMSGV